MEIEKNNSKVSRFESEFSLLSKESMSSDKDVDEVQERKVVVESDDEFDDADSGAGSDDFDLLELGETMSEFCQVGDQTCSLPFELYDLPDLSEILSLEVWNECLTEEDRFSLTKYLPDLEQGTFMLTLKELFSGSNFHFGSPISTIFDMLKGGVCEPRVALYRQGLNFFQKRQHYHLLRQHQNKMVSDLYQIKEAWINCRGYSIEEKLRVLNIMRSEKSLIHEKMEDVEVESHSSGKEESDDALWNEMAKERNLGKKLGRNPVRSMSPALDFSSHGRPLALESASYGKRNYKGIAKLAGVKTLSAKELMGGFPTGIQGSELMPGSYSSNIAGPQQNKTTGYDSGAKLRISDHIRGDPDVEEKLYHMALQRDRNVSRGVTIAKPGVLKMGKKHEHLKGGEFSPDSFLGSPMLLKNGTKKTVNQLSDIEVLTAKPSSARPAFPYGRKANYNEYLQQYGLEDQMRSITSPARELPPKGNRVLMADRPDPFLSKKSQGETLFTDPQFKYEDWNTSKKKFKPATKSPDFKMKSRASGPKTNDGFLLSEYQTKSSQGKIRGKITPNGGREIEESKSVRRFSKSEETESDSSEQQEEEENSNPLMIRKSGISNGAIGSSRSSFLKSDLDHKNIAFLKKNKMENAGTFEGFVSSKKMDDFGKELHGQELTSKAKPKDKMQDFRDYLNSDGHNRSTYKTGLNKNGLFQSELGDRFQRPLLKSEPASIRHSSYLQNYAVDREDDAHETHALEDNGQKRISTKATKKRKGKADMTFIDRQDEDGYLQAEPPVQDIEDSRFFKKHDRLKVEPGIAFVGRESFELPVTEVGVTDPEVNTKPSKAPFPLITPTVHTGFSFSIIHLLSAVRMALITPHLEDSMEIRKQPEQNFTEDKTREVDGVVNRVNSHNIADVQISTQPSLTVQEIVNRVRSNPGDPCILETQEPLQDLVRGVMKIFSSRAAPLGAKGWKPLVVYEKSSKGWSWIGPISQNSLDHDVIEEVTSPETWGFPYKMLVKMVDSFANWLKSSQETLQQIGNLPAPPESLLQFNSDEKDRFKDLRVQKSLNTINQSTEEVRAYFRREEVLRYSIPDRAFSYTAADGKKSIVAPLRRCGGKPTSKARDHFMLKRDRPPHVTILCLVRDAASRLPGSIGTRADVCTLIRDSQFVVEDVSDAQVNQVVSGALDRLHYERDPCVQFDSEKKLWVYLHKDREEEDFEDDGTSSTKKWKRQKKDPVEQIEQAGAVTVAFPHGNEEQQTGFDLCTDLNAEPSPYMMNDDKGMELMYDEKMEQSQPMGWEALGLNSTQESNLVCRENGTNEDFD